MTHISLPSGEYIFVEVPDCAVSFDIDFGGQNVICIGEYIDVGYILTPPGSYTLIGKGLVGDLTEDDLKNVVRVYGLNLWVNYGNGDSPFCSTAIESFRSLLTANGVKQNSVMLKKNV